MILTDVILYDILNIRTFEDVKNAIAGMNVRSGFIALATLVDNTEYKFFREFADYVALLNKYAGSATAYRLLLRIESYNTHVIFKRYGDGYNSSYKLCSHAYIAMLERLGRRYIGTSITLHARVLQHAYGCYEDYSADPIVNAIINHKTAMRFGSLQSCITKFINVGKKSFYARKIVETYRESLLYIIYRRLQCGASLKTLKFLCEFMTPGDIITSTNIQWRDNIIRYCLTHAYSLQGKYDHKVNKKCYAVMRAMLICMLSPSTIIKFSTTDVIHHISILEYAGKLLPHGNMAILIRNFNFNK